MASILKINGKWRAEVRTKGFYRCRSFATKPEAQGWALETERLAGKNNGHIINKTLGDAALKYIDEVSPAHKSRWEVPRLRRLATEWIADEALADLTQQTIQRWVAERLASTKASSVNREINLLSSVLQAATNRWNWIAANPIKGIRRPKNPPARDVRISPAAAEKILLALEYEETAPVATQRQRIAVAFLLAIETAMRQGELWGLDWRRVNLAGRYVVLEETKNGSRREVPLSTRAVALFEKLQPKNEGRVFNMPQESAGQLFRRAVELAGYKGKITFHDTRHEALTRLARKLDATDLARMVGHRDPRSLMIYYNATATEIAGRLG